LTSKGPSPLAGILFGIVLLAVAAIGAEAAPTVRVKDIAYVQGVRDNQLLGVGLVTGLAGQGDSSNSEVLRTTLANLFARFGISVVADDISSKNVAVVTVSAELPAFIQPGDRLDVTVSSLGDARGLQGGVLLQAPLTAANGQSYAVAQGSLLTAAEGASVRTVGTIPGGAIVERPVATDYITDGALSLVLRNADFVTANAMAEAIRAAFPEVTVQARDASIVDVQLPLGDQDVVSAIARLEQVTVIPDTAGRVVIDSRSGVVIVGDAVRIGRVAVSYRDAQVRVATRPRSRSQQRDTNFVIDDTTTVQDFVSTLQQIGLEADAVIGIMRAIDRAGALFGALVII
jgi:flagellar P-ring protein precursor FlgI